ncbi:MAG: lipoyl(octanoyl) transferase LipB [Acidobacteria bacterium]|nr:lipoyl(octanoyl) transferase LipB [Acidobacteriota bacterium]
MTDSRVCQVKNLGLVDYEEGLKLQQAFLIARTQDIVPDTLFFLEHPHVITLGRGAKSTNIITPEESLKKMGVGLYETGRGGDVTYHGLGQVVGYPIINLSPDRRDVHRYVRDLEEVMICAANDFGINASRISGLTGIWVGQEKLAAIGVRISRWITMHGFAFNVNTDLNYFKLIVPCGISDRGVTSLEKLLGEKISLEKVRERLSYHFGQVFGRTIEEKFVKHSSVQVVIFDDSLPNPEYLVLRRTKERGSFWQPVTGKIKSKKGELPKDAALREVFEETGLQGELLDLDYTHSFYIEPQFLKKSYPDPQINLEYSFALRTSKQAVKISPKEHMDYAWLNYEQAYERLIWNGNQRAFSLTQALIKK